MKNNHLFKTFLSLVMAVSLAGCTASPKTASVETYEDGEAVIEVLTLAALNEGAESELEAPLTEIPAPSRGPSYSYPETINDLPGGQNIAAIYMGLICAMPYLRSYGNNGIVPTEKVPIPSGVKFSEYAGSECYYIPGYSSIAEMYAELEDYITTDLIKEARSNENYGKWLAAYAEKDGKVYLDPQFFAHGWTMQGVSETKVTAIDPITCSIPAEAVSTEDGHFTTEETYFYTLTKNGWRLSKVTKGEGHLSVSDEAIGTLKVNVIGLNSRKGPGTSYDKLNPVEYGDMYPYYEVQKADGYTWYRIEENRWIADNGNWLEFMGPSFDTKAGHVRVLVYGLNSRKAPTTSAEKLEQVKYNDEFDYTETAEADGYTWYKIDENRWIADNGSWLEVTKK